MSRALRGAVPVGPVEELLVDALTAVAEDDDEEDDPMAGACDDVKPAGWAI